MKTMLLILMSLVPQDEKAIKDKQAEVMAFVKSAKNERDFRAATADLSKLAEQAFGINKYELSAKLYADSEKIAQANLKDTALAQSFGVAGKKASDIGKEYAKAAKAMGRILTNEGTPEDFTASGKFLCFVKGDWELGLNDLSKGKDETLKKLAEDDLAAGNSIALADAWFALLKKEPAVKERALYWYAKAWPKLSGVSKEKVRERAKTLHRVGTGKRGPAPSGWQFTPEQPDYSWLDPEIAHSGKFSICHRSSSEAPVGRNRQIIQIRAGAKLKVSYWCMTDGEDGVSQLSLAFTDAAGKPTGPSSLVAPNDFPFWVRLQHEVTVPTDAVNCLLDFQRYCKTPSAVWIDDVSVLDESGVELVKNGGFEDKK